MTTKEILQADMLDILFEKRNKAYGAYALRRSYDSRLLSALGAGIATAFLFILVISVKKKENTIVIADKQDGMVIREYVIPQKKIAEPEKPKQPAKPKATVKTARVKFTSNIAIRKDELVKSPVTSVENLAEKIPGDQDIPGNPDDGTVNEPESPGTGNGNTDNTAEQPVNFIPLERDPEFPGGAGALQQFLARNLRTPDEMDAGEKKVVIVQFKVDRDGSVNSFVIAESAGREFDQEVLRVVKKMPRWQPAFQNGIHVPVFYRIPVTFVGVEY